MALVGTISGSNGTTTSAVSGSLIIANKPPGLFPSLPAGVDFYVSGSAEITGNFTATGSIKALAGFSGSLTKLTDGADYLIAGSNITLSTGSSGAVTIANTTVPTLGAVYGGGADGAFDLDGTNTYPSYFTKAGAQYTQIVDVKATTLTVRSGSILFPSQFWLFAETSFTVDSGGAVRNNGNNGSLGVAGAQIALAGTLQTLGAAGGAGRSLDNSGLAGSATTNTIGAGGGAGGTGGGANVGGFGGLAGAIAASTQGLGTPIFLTSHRVLVISAMTAAGGGCGGGSGGTTLNGGTATSGAGGGGAGAIRINARSLNNSGTISCNGGTGGNATATGAAVSGGGGGGGGGFVGISTNSYTNNGTISCLGGNGGTGAGAGAGAGVAGSQGRVSVATTTGTTNS